MSPSFSMTARIADMSSLIFFTPLLCARRVNRFAMILLEKAFGENGRKYQGEMPTDVDGLFGLFGEIVGGRVPAERTFVVTSDDAGRYLRQMSGELLGDCFVYTVGEAEGISPAPLRAMVAGTLGDLRSAGRSPAGTKFRFTDGDSDYAVKEIRWSEEEGDGGRVWLIFVELEKTGEAKAGGSAYAGMVDTAAKFAKAVDGLAARTGRDARSQPCVGVDGAGDVFTVNPRGDGTEKATKLTLQKAFKGLKIDDPEVRTFGEIADFMKSRPPKSYVFLLAPGRRAYGIESIEYEAGQRPVMKLRPWTELDESARRAEARRKTRKAKALAEARDIRRWAKWCEGDLLSWVPED